MDTLRTRNNVSFLNIRLAQGKSPEELMLTFAHSNGSGLIGNRSELDIWASVAGPYYEQVTGIEMFAAKIQEEADSREDPFLYNADDLFALAGEARSR